MRLGEDTCFSQRMRHRDEVRERPCGRRFKKIATSRYEESRTGQGLQRGGMQESEDWQSG